MPEFTPQLIITIVVAMVAGAALLGGFVALLHSKTGQAVEAEVQELSFETLEKGIEMLADDSGDDKEIARLNAAKAGRRQQLNAVREKLAKLPQ